MNNEFNIWLAMPALLYALYLLWMIILELIGEERSQLSVKHKVVATAIGAAPFALTWITGLATMSIAEAKAIAGVFFPIANTLMINIGIAGAFACFYIAVIVIKKLLPYFFSSQVIKEKVEVDIEVEVDDRSHDAYWRTDKGYWSTHGGYWG